MSESFGARLRRQREQQNIALATIAEQTKIKESLLDALERDDVSRWPSGIFRRAYVRAYANAIGLCPDVVVREFLELYPDPDEDVAAIAAAASGDPAAAAGGPPTRLRFIVGSAIASLSRFRRNPDANGPVAPDAASGHAPGEPQPRARREPGSSTARVSANAAAIREAERDGERTSSFDVAPNAERDSFDAGPQAERTSSFDAGHDAAGPPALDLTPEPERTSGTGVANPPTTIASASSSSAPPPAAAPDFTAVAKLCTELGRAVDASGLKRLLHEAARLLDANGLILWTWDAAAAGLRPALVWGYSDEVVAQLPVLPRDADNATATAFRTAEACVVDGRGHGALVVPLLGPAGCSGVLALELHRGGERSELVRAAAVILAALLAQLTGAAPDAPV